MSASPIQLVKRYLCVKKLTINDGFTCKSIKLPRAEARFFIGELRNRQAIPLVLLDEDGSSWEFVCTCIGAQYNLTRIGAFCESHNARPGYYFIFYADHEHMVRLAVRQQLPENDQAAIAAARAAALVLRSSCLSQRSAQPPHDQDLHTLTAKGSSSFTASLPVEPSSHPILDHPVALDELPLSGPELHNPIVSNTEPVVKHRSTAEPAVRSMPLQDRSNLLEGVPLTDRTSNPIKSKSLFIKVGYSVAVSSPTACTHTSRSGPVADKENNVSALAHPILGASTKMQPNTSALLITSTGGLHAPAPASNRIPLQPQQQQLLRTALQPTPPPPPPSSSLSRSPPAPTSPPPATRLRLRFEARLRAQSGKLHPLSVRTGPESPLPSPPGTCGDTAAWPGTPLCGAYTMRSNAAAFLGGCGINGLLPSVWGLAGAWGLAAHQFHPDLSAAASISNRLHHPSEQRSWTVGSGIDFGNQQFSVNGFGNAPLRQLQATRQLGPNGLAQGTKEAGCATLVAMQHERQQQPFGEWLQQLQCDELLDWEADVSPNKPLHIATSSFAHHRGPRYPTQPHAPSQQQHSLLPCDVHPAHEPNPAMFRKLPMDILRLFLQTGQHGIPLHAALSHAVGDGGPLVHQRYGGQPFLDNLSMQGGTRQHLPQSHTQERSLPSLAATNFPQRQRLGMSAAVWDHDAVSDAAVISEPAGLLCRNPRTCILRDPPPAAMASRPAPLDHATHAAVTKEGSPTTQKRPHVVWPTLPAGAQGLQDTDVTDMDVNCAPPPALQHHQHRTQVSFGVSPVFHTRERDCFIDMPSYKRQRSAPHSPEKPLPLSPGRHRLLLARKALTTRDLLTDRLMLSVAPAVSVAVARWLPGRVAAGERPVDSTSPPRVGSSAFWQGAAAMANPKELDPLHQHYAEQQDYLASEPQRLLPGAPVDVVVESGAHYEGVLLMTCDPGAAWELQGLRPYLIRRQAGVGDVLSLTWADVYPEDLQPGGGSSSDCVRLVAQLQQV